ncbi:hypothetical protein ACWA5Z_09995 [Testudinibacter sp. P80/BLE/0925]|uniref:hypothetical protein n=1 Tax=Testudinibacter sp. TW-1 TaxID=3417757 RepID=UPI003D35C6AE
MSDLGAREQYDEDLEIMEKLIALEYKLNGFDYYFEKLHNQRMEKKFILFLIALGVMSFLMIFLIYIFDLSFLYLTILFPVFIFVPILALSLRDDYKYILHIKNKARERYIEYIFIRDNTPIDDFCRTILQHGKTLEEQVKEKYLLD